MRNTGIEPEQLAFPIEGAFTVADLDEWIADVEKGRWDTTHVPNEWARSGLAGLLGKAVPNQLWTSKDLLATLRRARERARA